MPQSDYIGRVKQVSVCLGLHRENETGVCVCASVRLHRESETGVFVCLGQTT